MLKKLIVCSIFVLTFSLSSSILAQSAGLNFTLGFPSGEFKQNLSRTGVGISGQFLLWNPTVDYPFSAGINVGFLNYGSESRREPF
ncbi:MAG: hypothetical protein ABI550_05790, partial [Ignavibacteriaceae bacterium]